MLFDKIKPQKISYLVLKLVFLKNVLIQDSEGAVLIVDRVKYLYPLISKIYADGGYTGEKLKASLKHHKELVLQIVKVSDTQQGFVLLPKRWVVERTIAWLNRCRRLAKDWEMTITSSTA